MLFFQEKFFFLKLHKYNVYIFTIAVFVFGIVGIKVKCSKYLNNLEIAKYKNVFKHN